MKRLAALPVFIQVLALVLAGVVAAQAINVAVIAITPDPPPPGFSVADAARALRGERVELPGGGALKARALTGAPRFAAGPHAPLAAVIAETLARALRTSVSDVRIEVRIPTGTVMKHSVVVRPSRTPAGGERREEVVTMRMVHAPQADGPQLGLRGAGVDLASDALVFPPFAAAVRQPDGTWRVVEPPHRFSRAWQHRLMLSFVLAALVLAPLAWLFARGLSRPIGAFAAGAERLGADPDAPPLTPAGPAEVRTATAAFNGMQARLRRYVEGRTAMLAAIAHDLRTPLTRIRFHAEAAPAAVRAKINGDIAEMDAMIGQVLAFVRSGAGPSVKAPLDVSSLVEAVCDDFAEVGAAVSRDVAPGVRLNGEALGLRRLASNLIDNALTFAGAAEVSLTQENGAAVLRVRDRGPGLPAAELERAFEPFHRLEGSRSRDTGGVGLGLATARAIARDHGGEVTLTLRDGGGLEATVRLPLE